VHVLHSSFKFCRRVRPEDLMSRCAKCNGLGYEHVGRPGAKARGDVPDKVRDNTPAGLLACAPDAATPTWRRCSARWRTFGGASDATSCTGSCGW